jgi:hypothetical protein
MPERRTVQIKTPIAGNSQSIAKIGNAELAHFNKQMLIHELIRGSLTINTSLLNCDFYPLPNRGLSGIKKIAFQIKLSKSLRESPKETLK